MRIYIFSHSFVNMKKGLCNVKNIFFEQSNNVKPVDLITFTRCSIKLGIYHYFLGRTTGGCNKKPSYQVLYSI